MSDYQEAIQSPRLCFSDGELKSGTPALNPLGLPQPITGGFASVYQVRNGKGRWAVRCFLHRIADLRERYALISQSLKKNPLRFMVGFDYLPEGIRVKGGWYPALKMEWVNGDTLNIHVQKSLKSPKALLKLAERWTDLVESLERSGIAHGDLQHGNILVQDGQLRLIDYDGMFVPALKGRGSHEKGHPAYQHPERSGPDFDAQVDRFSALVIHLSLLALAKEPRLWQCFYEDDNLIFRRADFASPEHSRVFQALEGVSDPLVVKLTQSLRRACQGNLADVPRLKEAREGKASEPARPAAPSPVYVEVPGPRRAPPPPTLPPPPQEGPIELPKWLEEKPKVASTASGWHVEWVRPGQLQERHVYKEPVYGTREAPRRFFFLPLGTRRVRFVERYEDRVKERTSTVDGHRSTITSLAFSADGATLASGSLDRTLRVWNVAGGREVSLLLEARAGVLRLAFVPGRAALVAALDDRRLVIWDYGLQRQVIHLEAPDRSRLEAVAVSPDGRWVAAGGTGRSVFVWQVDRGTLAGAFHGLSGKVRAAAFTGDASGVLCATRNGRLELVDRGSGKTRWSTKTGIGPLAALAVPPKGLSLTAAGEGGRARSWDLRDGRDLSTRDLGPLRVRSAALSSDTAHALVGLDDRTARLVRVSDGGEAARMEGLPGRVTAVALSPTGKAAATGCNDGSVRLWMTR